MHLRRYNELQQKELQRVRDEIKWYLGEQLHHDPYLNQTDRTTIEDRFAEIIIKGFGAYLASLNKKTEQQENEQQRNQ